MKRVLSLVLAVLTVLAIIPAAVTAESFESGFRNDSIDATGNAANLKAYHIDSKYFAMSYTFTLLTAQPYAEGDNGCVGISLGANEDGYGWNGWNWYADGLYTAGDDVNLKLVVKNNVAKIYINDQLVHTTPTRHNGDGFGLWSKGEGTEFKNVKVTYEINAPEVFEDFPELNEDVTGFYQVRENVNGTRDVRISALGVDELLTKYDTCKFVISYTENGVEKTQDVVYNSTKVFKYLDDESSYISFGAPDGWHMLVLVITGIPESVTGFTVKELVLEGAGMEPYTYTDLGSGII